MPFLCFLQIYNIKNINVKLIIFMAIITISMEYAVNMDSEIVEPSYNSIPL